MEEVLRGRLGALARRLTGRAMIQEYAHLAASVEMFNLFQTAPFDAASEGEYRRLVGLRLRVGTQDLKIAAVALAAKLTVLTRNLRDFGQVPGLTLDDWSA